MQNIIWILLFMLSFQVSAQSKKEIREKGITVIKSYEQDIDQGEKELLLEKEEYFNSKGQLVELKEVSEKGRVKKWEKYVYTDDGEIAEEIILDFRGDVDKRIEYKYENGLRTQKLYFDSKNRMYKKRQYEYQFNW